VGPWGGGMGHPIARTTNVLVDLYRLPRTKGQLVLGQLGINVVRCRQGQQVSQ